MMPFRSAALRRTVSIAVILTIGWTLAAWPARSLAAPLAQEQIAAITAPTEGQELQGVVTITGSANHPEFDRYELAFGPEPIPTMRGSPSPPINSRWRTMCWACGTRPVLATAPLRCDCAWYAKTGNYDEVFIRGLRVINQQARSTPTPSAADASPTPEATTDLATAVPGVEPTFAQRANSAG